MRKFGILKAELKSLFVGKRSALFAHAGKWTIYYILIGIIAGIGAVVFHYLCQIGIHFFMDFLAGYRPPGPAGEHHLFPPTPSAFNRYLLLLIPALGGILSGILVYTFAPEAEGHGTDAAIDAYHNKSGFIRGRVPIIKTLASAITLTSGGSGGREGPIAQIGAGFGSYLATLLKLSERERRIMMAAGIGAGVGSIFRAPLAGALFAAEVLYRDPDFEYEVIIPSGIASVVAYCIFCLVYGWGSLFESPYFKFQNPLELGPYLVLAVVLSGAGALYVKSFYGVTRYFRKLQIPKYFKPALGGLCTGIIGFFLPQTLAFGYGFAQKALNNELTIPFLLALGIGKIFTTSFSIGSGGSGGVFGPSIVIGGAMGGAVGRIFHGILPGVVGEPGAFVVVGMAGFFTSVSNTPISTIIMVSEMTNSYHLLLPSLLVCSVAYLLSKRWTIYEKQVKSRIDSPAHAGDFFVDVLQAIRVKDMLQKIRKVQPIPQGMRFSNFKHFFSSTTQHYFPVMDQEHRLTSIFSINDVRSVLFSKDLEELVVMKDIGTSDIISITPSEDLNSVLRKFTEKNIDELPVVADEDSKLLLGMLSRRDVIACYNQRIEELKKTREPNTGPLLKKDRGAGRSDR
ncbi:MAG: chloride channel protein [Thermodesulfobacteriota bacterium]